MARTRSGKRPIDKIRTAASAPGFAMVRTPGILERIRSYVAEVDQHSSSHHRSPVGNMADPPRQHSLGLWRRILCHALPVIASLVIAAIGIWAYGSRQEPRIILAADIFPNATAPGNEISVIYAVTDYRECRGVTHRWIVDSIGIIHVLPDADIFHRFWSNQPRPQTYNLSRDFRVPLTASFGEATFHAQTERWCSPIQYFFPIMQTEEAIFTVMKP
jgi:hypothetical protein